MIPACHLRNSGAALVQGLLVLKNYGSAMYGFRSKLLCLPKLLCLSTNIALTKKGKVINNIKDANLQQNIFIFIDYNSVNFYQAPGASVTKLLS
jgi:hypothetical protein